VHVRGVSLDCNLSFVIQWVRTRAVVKAFLSASQVEWHSSENARGYLAGKIFETGL